MVLTKHRKPRFVLMSYEYYERMRTCGDPRSVHRASEMPEEHREAPRRGDRPAGAAARYDDES